MNSQYVESLKDKEAVTSVFLATEKQVGNDKNGKAFLSVNLSDSTGFINARLWDKVDELKSLFDAGDFVQVKGHVQVYQNRKQIIIHDIRKAPKELIGTKSFVSQSQSDPVQCLNDIESIVAQMKNEHIKQLLQDVLKDQEIYDLLLKTPAAKTIHHAYVGGLAEHILSICRTLQFIAKQYSELDEDLLIFGGIFHDLGKIWELSVVDGIKYTDKGRLVGHMAIACDLIEKKSGRILGFPEILKDLLKHIVLSHHGRLEYGSPKLPMLPEAVVVAMIDELDSKLNTILNFMKMELSTGEPWTKFHQQLDRYFYLEILRQKQNPQNL